MAPTANELHPGLTIVHANHPEDLRQLVAQLVQRSPVGPLENEVFLVQSNGMAQWLKLKLAQDDACGIAAGLDMQMPSRFLWSAYRAVIGADAVPTQSPFDKEPLTWRLMRLLPTCLGDEIFAPLRHFLAGDGDLRKRYQLAERLADLFDQYQVYRADWLAAWQRGENNIVSARQEVQPLRPDQRWQAQLWRLLQEDIGPALKDSSRAEVHRRFLEQVRALKNRPPGLPRRLIVFGISSLPQQILEALDALSRHMLVQIFVHNPCQYYWADIIEERQLLRFERYRHADKPGLDGLDPDQLHIRSNPLLAAWGKQGRDYIGLLYGYDTDGTSNASIDVFRDRSDAARPCLLHQVQQQILDLEPLPAPDHPEERQAVLPSECSIRFQLAHSRQREVEILHDQLLALLDDENRKIQPRDIIVMVPDIALYAPHIEAVFGRLERSDPRFLPYSIADRTERASNPVLAALESLLALPESRFAVSDVLALLDVAAFRKTFGLTAEDLPRLHQWIEDSGIRWGLHSQQRKQLELPDGLHQNSWQFGLQRMLLGYASGNSSAWLGIEPYDELGGLDAAIAGKLCQVLETLERFWHLLRAKHTATDWGDHLRALIGECLQASDSDILVLEQFQAVVSKWQTDCQEAGLTEELPLPVVRDALLTRFDEGSQSQRFLAGRINFGTLMPMRAIPFQAVCLLGMNDGEYPRQRPPLDFDLMAEQYRPGDRSRQEDDRYLFLEALLSARQVLYISWLGRSERDNTARTPSVLVGQLRDYLDAGWRWVEEDDDVLQPDLFSVGSTTDISVSQALTIQHPLQPFSRHYFEAAGDPADPFFTYAHEWATVHSAVNQTDAPTSSNFATAESQVLPEKPMEQALTLEQLRRFMRYPADNFFNQRLNVWFSQASETAPDDEPFELNGLERYQCKSELFDGCRAVSEREQEQMLEQGLARLGRAGHLPMGEAASQQICDQLRADTRQTLAHWNRVMARWSTPVDPLELDLVIDVKSAGCGTVQSLRLSDWIACIYRDAQGNRACILAQPGQVWNGKQGKQSQLKHHYFLGLWLSHLALAAAGDPLTCILVATDGSHTLPPLSQAQAKQTLQKLLVSWYDAQHRCLPLGMGTAMALLRDEPEERADPERYQSAYSGADFGPRGDVNDSAALARCWPEFTDAWNAGLPDLAVQTYGDFFEAVANRETEK